MEPLWSRPDDPAVGDKSDWDTYAGVGHVLSAWEEIEAALGAIYCCFLGRPFERSAILEYGQGQIFRERANKLQSAAEVYFRKHCNQANEAQFDAMLTRVREYSAHRNDVAHAVVRADDWVDVGGDGWGTTGFYLLPSHYDPRRYGGDQPDFVYTSPILLELAEALGRLRRDVLNFRLTCWDLLGQPK